MIWRRRQSIVNLRQQLWFSLELLAVTFGFLIFAAYLMFLPPLNDLFGQGERAERLFNELLQVIFWNWPLAMVAILVLLGIGILLSHRLAGPLFGLERVAGAWKRGDRTARVHFRKYDFLLPANKPLNDFFDAEEILFKKAEGLAREIRELAASGKGDQVLTKANELAALLGRKDGET